MKNLKKLLAVIVAVCVLATLTVPAFAAASDAEICEALDILKGDGGGVTDTYLAKGTQRYQAAILYLRLIGLEDEAKAFEGEDNFDDADDIYAGGQKILAYLKANPDLGWVGVGGNKFEPAKPASAQMIYKVLLEALGYKQDVDFTWGEALDFAASVGLSAIADVTELTNADMAIAIVEALKANIKDSDQTLTEKLIEDDLVDEEVAAEYGLVELAPAALEVESVSVTNLREMAVTFNRAPVADAAGKTDNYKINDSSPEAVTVSDDGLTVIIRMAAGDKMGNYSNDNKLVIAKAVGFDEDKEISNIAAKDESVPVALNVEVTGPRNFKVNFSEPMEPPGDGGVSQIVNAFKLDEGTLALDVTKATFSGRTITLETLADLKEGEHKIAIEKDSAVKDGAGFSVAPVTLTFTYAKDSSPLTVEVVESTETTVNIKFNKAINPGTLVGNTGVLFRHTYNTSVNEANGTAVTNSGDNQTFQVNFGPSKPFPPGTTNLYIKYTDGAAKVKDYYGNELAETILSVTTTPDLTKPTVEGVKFVDSRKLEVTFSEVVASPSADNYTLKDSAGDAITITNATFKDGGNKVVVLDTDVMNGGSYTLTVKGVKDVSIAQNEIDEVTIAFDAEDKVAPEVNGNAKQISSKKIKVFFSEAMDPATTADKAQWKFKGVALSGDDTVEMTDSNKAVIITFKEDITIGDDDKLTLARVKDAAGNWMEDFQTDIDIDGLAPIKPSAIEVTSRSTIRLEFKNEVIVGAQASDFEVSRDGGSEEWNAVVGVATTVSDGTTEIILTLKGDQLIAEDNTTADGVEVRTKDGEESGSAKNTYDNKLKFDSSEDDSLTVADKMGPIISTAQANDADGDSKIDSITVTFSEDVYHPSITDADFEVEGYEIESIEYTDTDKVTIFIKEKDGGASDPKVKVVGEIEDSVRNKATGLEKQAAAPVAEP